jgi:hypothetical protein
LDENGMSLKFKRASARTKKFGFPQTITNERNPHHPKPFSTSKMSKKILQKDVIVKLIVGAGQASPSPPVGPALGSKGVKSMDFCKVRPPPTHGDTPPSAEPC